MGGGWEDLADGLSALGWGKEGALVAVLAGLAFTLVQLAMLRRQLQLDALLRIMEANRALVALGFAHPTVWTVMEDGPVLGAEAQVRRRYLQLWLNHMQVLWTAWRLGVVSGGEWQAYQEDMAAFLDSQCVQAHWARVARYYPRGFRRLIATLSPGGQSD
jgi:hypothetical protein